jgi:YfiH family protein
VSQVIGAFEVVTHEAFARAPLCHGFTTRRGEAGAVLTASGDFDPLARAAGFVELRTLSQVHGAEVIRAELAPTGSQADAVIAEQPGLLLGIQTADCVPVLFFDPRRRAIGAAHAGWRGTAARVAARTVQAMRDAYGSRPDELRVLLGPAIGPCCFEVGPEVRTALEEAAPGAGAAAGVGPNGGDTVSLWRANRLILEDAGVSPEHLAVVGQCTRCRVDLFPSFRRDGKACGRMLAFIGLTL